MSIEVTMNDAAIAAPDDGQLDTKEHPQPAFLHSPPDSNKVHKSDASDSELSDLDEEPILSDAPEPAPASDPPQPPQEEQQQEEEAPEQDNIGEVLPDHWSGTVPVFKPTMHQFKDFKRFMEAVDSYGMKSGIIKIIPPEEWKDSLPAIDDLIKQVRVREPIKQDIMGSNGTYRQMNILHGRSYNLPQWRQLCDQSEHQPPARRGERRANVEKPRATRSRAAAPKPANTETPKKRGRGRAPKGRGRGRPKKKQEGEEEDRPMTPVSPKVEADNVEDKPMDSIEKDPGVEVDPDEPAPTVGRMGGARQAKPQMQSVSARRKYSRREGSAMIDEAAFKDWDYKMDISEYTPERCEELERVYWKTLTYAPPLYGADLMGTLFHESTELWNLNKLPNLLDVLGTKVPGVNTAYLYLGMWKATFAWHLEDVDLYSINYLHFGAPKQWYSISQKDARRFEAAMKSIWPTDAKACDQFLRHKAFLISPQHLLNHFNIKVNKCLSYPGEFVVTYPYGYHSGYNLGYNCAEAVNFALDSWLDMGKIAKKCDCAQAQDSVWVNVYEIERRLRGEETEEEETEDEEEESDDEASGLPTPPASHGVKFKDAGRKRKRGPGGKTGKDGVKKIKLRIKTKAEPPCCLCPHDVPTLEILPTDDGRKAHRMCALYLPETFVETVDGKEVVCNVARIHKDRLDLKCLYCRSKRGACFQCSQKRCARSYHATCAAAAGVFVEEEEVPVFGEDGTEYKEQAFEFSCRFHRTKRDRKVDGDALENDSRITAAAAAVKKGDICQLQYHKGEIFGGLVVENRTDEQTFLLDILPTGDRLEVEWKWLLLADPSDYHLPKASANAIPMPTTREAKDSLKAKRGEDDKPRKDDPFAGSYTWAEFHLQEVSNKNQVKVDFTKPDQVWHYLGKTSTEARAQYTEDPSQPRHNPRGNYLDTIPKTPKPLPAAKAVRYSSYGGTGNYGQQYNTSTMRAAPAATTPARPEKPYVYKPRKPIDANFSSSLGTFTSQRFTPMSSASPTPRPQVPSYSQYNHAGHQGYQNQGIYSAQRFEVKGPQHYMPPQSVPQPHYPTNVPTRPVQHQWMQPMSVSQPPVATLNIQRPAAPVSYQQPAPAPVQATMPAPVSAAPAPVSASPVQSRPHTRPTWQVHSSIYQKYEFFQVHHNRDSTKYRTPYSPYGGFTNGYEGNLRAHLMANKDELLRRSSIMSSSPPQQPAYPVPAYHSTYNTVPVGAPQTHGTSQVSSYNYHQQQPAPAPQQPTAATTKSHPHLPPAIKSQYLPAQPSRSPAQKASTESKPKPAPVPKSYKLPPKESPVPLPAGFLAAMASTTATPASAAKAALKATSNKSPTSAQSLPSTAPPTQLSPSTSQAKTKPGNSTPSATSATQPTSVKPESHDSSISLTTVTFAAPLNQIPPPVASPSTSGPSTKISVTPVPIPKLPGMVQQTRPAESPVPLPQPLKLAQVATPTTQTPSRPVLQIQTSQQPVSLTVPTNSETGPSTNTGPQEFPDVPGGESMEFIQRLIGNLRKAAQHYSAD